MSEPNDLLPYQRLLQEVDPRLEKAQLAWLSAVDSIEHLDRKTTALIRLAITAIARQGEGCQRHAQLAAEAGASWEEILSALVLTQPAFGLVPAAEAYPHARRGFDAAEPAEAE